MTTLAETDTHLVKCIGFLHSSTKLRKGDPVPLQYILEEAIKNKFGVIKDYTDLVQACLKPREEEFTPVVTTTVIEESKGSNSDDELELDLLKEDLMCIICNGMDVGARNRLLECFDCHSLYHQECHKPGVTEDSFENWVCFNCTEASKKIKVVTPPVTVTSTVIINSANKSPKLNSTSHRHSGSSTSSSSSSSSSYKPSSYSKSGDKYKSGSSSKSSGTSSSTNSKVTTPPNNINSNNPSRNSLPPNINIISADKRIQIMKKKAATKLQEKRKLPR